MTDLSPMNPYIATLRELRTMRRHVDEVMAERFPLLSVPDEVASPSVAKSVADSIPLEEAA